MTPPHFLFFIFSSLDRRKKANLLYHLLYRKLSQTSIYILYFDPTLDTLFKIQNHEITLQSGNHYEDAPQKTLAMIHLVNQLFSQVSGLFKCDDIILPNLSAIQKFIKNMAGMILKEQPIDYAGVLNKTHFHKKFRYNDHFGLCHDPLKNQQLVQLPRNLTYARNPFYYLSQKALRFFTMMGKGNSGNSLFYDDVMIAQYLLTQAKIVPHSMEFFHTDMDYLFQTNIFNKIVNGMEMYKTLYITLQGNLGERMFQTAAAYGIAKLKKMYLVFIDPSQYDVFHRIFLKEFPRLHPSKIDDILDEAYPIIENEHSGLFYKEHIIPEAVFATNRDVFMSGYFKNIQYFQHCTLDIFSLFHAPLTVAKQIFQHRGISSGFKAIRRYSTSSNISTDSATVDGSQCLNGGGLDDEHDNNPAFDKCFFIYISEHQTNSFLTKAIAYLMEYEMKPYFYVLSHFDDLETNTRFPALQSLEKTIVTIRSVDTGIISSSSSGKSIESECSHTSQISDNSLIDALAIMTLCKKGGITSAKDPISWWGGFLNDNIRKIIVHEPNIPPSSSHSGIFIKGSGLLF